MTRPILVRQRDVSAYTRHRGRIPGQGLPAIIEPVLSAASVIGCAVTDEQVIALTYDDGPDPVQTPAILDALEAAGAKATFFVLVSAARAHPEIIEDILARGHELGLHGADHARLSALGTRQVEKIVQQARDELSALAGTPVHLFRPAYGSLTFTQVVALRRLGLEIVLWSGWARDWKNTPVESMVTLATTGAHPGGILLLHDGAQGQARIELPGDFPKAKLTADLIANLHADGYSLVTVSELLTYGPGRMRCAERVSVARRFAVTQQAHSQSTTPAAPQHSAGQAPTDGEHAPTPAGQAAAAHTGPIPTLSVVIACYNGAATLPAQLDALARQDSDQPFEVIVADNASTDDSAQIARSYAQRGQLDVRVVDAGAVKGPGHARNVGVMSARSPLIAFCDADDVVAEDWVRHMLIALSQDDFVAGRVDVETLNSAGVRRTRTHDQTDQLQRSGTAGGLPHAGAGNMGLTAAVYRSVGGFDEGLRCLQDSDLCWRIQLAGTPLTYHRDVLIYTRMRSTLRTMAAQGYRYGRSYAQLESRYGTEQSDADGVDGDAATPPQPEQSSQQSHSEQHDQTTADGPVGKLLGYYRTGGLGGLVWNIAWHLGHRRATKRLADQGAPAMSSCLLGAQSAPASAPVAAAAMAPPDEGPPTNAPTRRRAAAGPHPRRHDSVSEATTSPAGER